MPSYTYAIGDAHGRFDLVREAVALSEQHCGASQGCFVSCGDFIDRGPASKEIIEFFMEGPRLPNWQWQILAGNHEDMMGLACRSLGHMKWWLGNGGNQTLRSYGAQEGMTYDRAQKLVPKEHLCWLDSLPIYHLDTHRAFVHAGFDPSRSLKDQSRHEMTWMRDGKDTNYSFLGKHVVHGHEQFQEGPILNSHKTNLDVYAWRFGRLAVAVFDNSKPGGPIDILWVKGPSVD